MLFSNLNHCLFKNKVAVSPLPAISQKVIPAPNTQFAQAQVINLAKVEQRSPLPAACSPTFILDEMSRLQSSQQIQDSNQKTEALIQMMMLALQTGNIDLAMLIFASLETRQSNEVTKMLGQKLLEAQNERRQLTASLAQAQGQKDANQGQITQIQGDIQAVNDTLQMLTSFIKDIQDQKNRTVEFSNQFLNNEHQTTMSIVRSMRG